jgi:hypothetical protein
MMATTLAHIAATALFSIFGIMGLMVIASALLSRRA